MDIKLHVHEAGNLKPPDRIFNAYSSDVGKKEIMQPINNARDVALQLGSESVLLQLQVFREVYAQP